MSLSQRPGPKSGSAGKKLSFVCAFFFVVLPLSEHGKLSPAAQDVKAFMLLDRIRHVVHTIYLWYRVGASRCTGNFQVLNSTTTSTCCHHVLHVPVAEADNILASGIAIFHRRLLLSLSGFPAFARLSLLTSTAEFRIQVRATAGRVWPEKVSSVVPYILTVRRRCHDFCAV